MKTVKQSGEPFIILGAGMIVMLMVAVDYVSPLRPVFVFGFLFIGPGIAFVRLLHLRDHFAEFMLAVALSLVIDTLISEMLVLLRIWSPAGNVLAIVIAASAGAIVQLIGAQRTAATAED